MNSWKMADVEHGHTATTCTTSDTWKIENDDYTGRRLTRPHFQDRIKTKRTVNSVTVPHNGHQQENTHTHTHVASKTSERLLYKSVSLPRTR